MRTISKSLITLSMCLGLSAAVYAQATPVAGKTSAPAAASAKSKPATPVASKNQPAAVNGASATPAVKTAKHVHAQPVTPKAAIEKKSNKAASPDAKLQTTPAHEMKQAATK